MLLSSMLRGLGDAYLMQDCDVTGIAYDSREVKEGFLFVAIKGYELDGHIFVGDAFSRGASGVVVQDRVSVPPGKGLAVVADSRFALSHLSAEFYRNPSRDLLVVGITGTKGKTTTCHMIKQMLEASGYSTGLVGTVQNIIGNECRPVRHTTPEALDLFEMQREMVDKGCKAVTMEVSSHALSLSRVSHVDFDIAVFTNIGTDHLDFHNTLDDYVKAKGKLFESLGKRALPGKEFKPLAILNRDDRFCDYFESVTSTDTITYGFSQEADVRAHEAETGPKGSVFTLSFAGKDRRVRIGLPGKFNIANALAASALGFGIGMGIDEVAVVLSELKGVRGRAELVPESSEFTVWVDYAHTPESLRDILMTARDVSENRVIAVFGCGGDRDKHKRPIMGRIAGEIADLVVITDDNPRTEDEDEILDQIEIGVREAQEANPNLVYRRIKDRRKAISEAVSLASKGDIVVLAGKGHETYQIFKNKTVHFDDAEEVRKAIAKTRQP
jgi:UDP-N-acetylmuramoyl-L-alanyl-D-glutamate--2,6-diaminopimelate ligase